MTAYSRTSLQRVLKPRVIFVLLMVFLSAGVAFLRAQQNGSTAALHMVRNSRFQLCEEATGTIEPIRSTVVQSECLWTVEILSLLAEGTEVRKGDVVCILDSSEIEEFLRAREVYLINANARLTRSINDLELQESRSERKLAAARFSLDSAEMNLKEYEEGTWPNQISDLNRDLQISRDRASTATDEVEFMYGMWMRGMANHTQVMEAELDRTARTQQLRRLEGRKYLLEEYTNPVTTRKLNYQASTLRLNQERTELSNSLMETRARMQILTDQRRVDIYERYARTARESIEACTIRAPCDGKVLYANTWYERSRGHNPIETGRSVYRTQPIFQVPDESELKVQFPIHETLISRIGKGMTVDVFVAGYDDQPLQATVREISAYPRSRDVNGSRIREFVLDAVLHLNDEQREWVHSQMQSTVRVPLCTHESTIVIPRTAILRDGTTPSVLLQRPGAKNPLRIAVRPGEVSGDDVRILDGLREGDQIISDAAEWLRNSKS